MTSTEAKIQSNDLGTSDQPSPGGAEHGNSDAAPSTSNSSRVDNHLITDPNYPSPTPNLMSPTIPFHASPKMIWQSAPQLPLAFASPPPKYPLNYVNQISVVHSANNVVSPTLSMMQQLPQIVSPPPSFPALSVPPGMSASSVYRAAAGVKRQREGSFVNTTDPTDVEDQHDASVAVKSDSSGEGLECMDAPAASGVTTSPQSISWRAHQVDSWYEMCDATLQDVQIVSFYVEANKGFTYSALDETFVCQKKNHFQVTVTCEVSGTPRFIKMKDGGLQPIKRFVLSLYGIRLESELSIITLDKSSADRSKRKLEDVEIVLTGNKPVCEIIGRLHFRETTLNNMRKRGKPNPEQKYFSLVVALIAHTANGKLYTVVAHVSERIIVRASNPGTFDNENDAMWGRAASPNSIYYMGHVGINTDKPSVALSVHGDVQVAGKLLQPSDCRVKEDVVQIDPSVQLDNIAQLRVCRFSYTPEYAVTIGMTGSHDHQEVGLIAQELQQVIPDAVECNGDLELQNGEHLHQFLCIKKDRVLMESIGAIQELNRINHQLSARITDLEAMRYQSSYGIHIPFQHLKCFCYSNSKMLWRTFLLLMLLLSLLLLTILLQHSSHDDNWSEFANYHIRNGLLKHSDDSL